MNQWPNGHVGGLLLFAAGAADSLDYLVAIDQRAFGGEGDLAGHHEDVIDIAHARWASTSAISAVDLAAAAIGLLFLGPRKRGGEYDLADFDAKTLATLRSRSQWSADWVSAVRKDKRYADLLDARHALVHRRLRRTVKVPGRVGLHLESGEIDARALILIARDFASFHVGQVFDGMEQGLI